MVSSCHEDKDYYEHICKEDMVKHPPNKGNNLQKINVSTCAWNNSHMCMVQIVFMYDVVLIVQVYIIAIITNDVWSQICLICILV